MLAAAPEPPDRNPESLFESLAAAAAAAADSAAGASAPETAAAAVAAGAAAASATAATPCCSNDLLLQLHRHRIGALNRAEAFAHAELRRSRLPLMNSSSSSSSSSVKLPPRSSSRWSLLLSLYVFGHFFSKRGMKLKHIVAAVRKFHLQVCSETTSPKPYNRAAAPCDGGIQIPAVLSAVAAAAAFGSAPAAAA